MVTMNEPCSGTMGKENSPALHECMTTSTDDSHARIINFVFLDELAASICSPNPLDRAWRFNANAAAFPFFFPCPRV
jgi:hypothetical protein